MPGQTIDITSGDGKRFAGYLAVPEAGSGPGIVLLQEIFGVNDVMRAGADLFAEEGYVVLVPDLYWRLQPGVELGFDPAGVQEALRYKQQLGVDQCVQDIGSTIQALKSRPECTGKVGVVGYCMGGLLAYLSAARLTVDVAIAFYGVGLGNYLNEASQVKCPLVFHFGAQDEHAPPALVQQLRTAFAGRDNVSIHVYPDIGHGFYLQGRPSYHKVSASMAHSPTIAALRRALGPQYDLAALWERHCELEFTLRDADTTMATMVAHPYVNHVPTMTGGVGRKELHRFYKHHFIPQLPKDTKLVSVSRTVGADRLVDELLFCFTHDIEIDWLLPGIKPTGKYVQAPTVAVVHFRGNKLAHEHIYWDQASVLVQIGLLDPRGLPVAGIETARKVVDEKLPSNTLMARWADSAGRP